MISDNIAREADINKIKSLGNTQRTIGYACAGVSLAGVIVLITGVYRDYHPVKGFAVGNNLHINGNAGVSMALTF